MTEAESAVFANGVDFVDDPSLLEGHWLEAWEQEVDMRVRSADVIALVRITTMRTDADLERRQTHRLQARVDGVRLGQTVREGEHLELVARPGEPGYPTVHENDARILNQRFVAFVRWVQPNPESPVVARWHLAPASERVVRRVNSLVEARRAPAEERRRVIVRDHPVEDD